MADDFFTPSPYFDPTQYRRGPLFPAARPDMGYSPLQPQQPDAPLPTYTDPNAPSPLAPAQSPMAGISPVSDYGMAMGKEQDIQQQAPQLPAYLTHDYTPEMQQYLQALQNYPRHDDPAYRPSWAARLGAIIGGFRYGPQFTQAALDEPYTKAMQEYGQRMGVAQQQFELPMEMQQMQAKQYYDYQRALEEMARAQEARSTAAYHDWERSPEGIQALHGRPVSLGAGRGWLDPITGKATFLPPAPGTFK